MHLINLVSPFKKITKSERNVSLLIVIGILLSIWSFSSSNYIPKPFEILKAIPKLLEKDLLRNFIHSLSFCFKSILYATAISLFFCYLSVLPMFSVFCQFLRKFRFLPSTGLSFLFMKITGNIDQQMSWMMIFGITTWLVDSMIGVALSISDDNIMYARSLRLSRWQTMRELLVFGKAADLFESIISNFAMAWMLLASIENIAKASGGIGVVLAESNKYFRFDQVYGIQLLILLTGISIDYLLSQSKKALFPWKQSN